MGGSDLAAILREDPFKREIDVFRSKVLPPAALAADAADWQRERADGGHLLEPYVLELYALGPGERHGVVAWPHRSGPSRVVRPPSVAHRARPWQRGSADGLVLEQAYHPDHPGEILAGWGSYYDDTIPAALVDDVLAANWDRGVEVKTHGWWAYRSAYDLDRVEEVGVPNDKRIQIAWYQELWDLDRWDLVALVDTHLRKQWTLHRDRQLGADLLGIAEEWWQRHVIRGVPPDPDGSESYSRHIRHLLRKHTDAIVPATPEVNALAAELRTVRQRINELEDARAKLEQRIQLAIGEAVGVDTELGRITWKSQRGAIKPAAALDAALRDLDITSEADKAAYLERFRGPDHRVLRVPRSFTSPK